MASRVGKRTSQSTAADRTGPMISSEMAVQPSGDLPPLPSLSVDDSQSDAANPLKSSPNLKPNSNDAQLPVNENSPIHPSPDSTNQPSSASSQSDTSPPPQADGGQQTVGDTDLADADLESQMRAVLGIQDTEATRQRNEHITASSRALLPSLPSSYTGNAPKEQLILDYVDNFRRQYAQVYPGRKDLLLDPPNEYGIKKFVCTTIRPTQLPFRQLYNYDTCARFTADYVSYIPLDPPHELPRTLHSPTFTLHLQLGTCFDLSVLLVSLLRGVGYEAYVVSGYASRDVTLVDETHGDMARGGYPGPYTGSAVAWKGIAGRSEKEREREEARSRMAEARRKKEEREKAVESGHGLEGGDGAGVADGGGEPGDLSDGPPLPSGPKYTVKPPKVLVSEFIMKQEAKARSSAQADDGEGDRSGVGADGPNGGGGSTANLADDPSSAMVDDDVLRGLRVHAWVLVLPGRREVAEAFFIESTTGRTHPLDHPSYLGVESVFSPHNYWVNMQYCFEGVKGISFDLADNNKWEFVVMDNTVPGVGGTGKEVTRKPGSAGSGGRGVGGGGGGGNGSGSGDAGATQGNGGGGGGQQGAPGVGSKADDDEEDGDGAEDQSSVDLPPSWVSALSLTQEQFEKRSPTGKKTVSYRNARVETFAEYHRQDGMVTRITYFKDEARGFAGEIREFFANRKDKLVERVRIPSLRLIHEFFDKGRPHALRDHVMVAFRTKEMNFYAAARFDGLLRRIDEGTKVVELYEERDDGLYYRSVVFDPTDVREDEETLPDRGRIVKMTEKFERNPRVPAVVDAQKKTYFVKEEKVRIIYHREPDRLVPSFLEFRKPSSDSKTITLELLNSFTANAYAKQPKNQQLFLVLSALLKTQAGCLAAIRTSEKEVRDILSNRRTEEKSIQLAVSVYDTIRNDGKTAKEEEEKKEERTKEEEERRNQELDYLSPFLINVADPTKLTPAEATAVRDACLKSLKERILEKANIIQSRLDELVAEYKRREEVYAKNSDTVGVDETEEWMRFSEEALFKRKILEKRLAKHKESSPEKYMALEKKLRSDPRLDVSGR
ncbi:hypothetical protein HDU93_006854 [Gonapodya sp. JEL0774]|nr:hypothetical protein HDU93_006854 [Gonapodya sp. JEL0774]